MYRFALCLLLAACAGKEDDTAEETDSDTVDTVDTDPATTAAGGCAGLCQTGGFTGGQELDYGDVVECVCEGSGTGLAQDDCSAYCADFGVAPEFSYLSENAAPNDKCVCDGTAG